MRIAAFNVENLFDRAKALARSSPPAERSATLEQHARVNALLEEPAYTAPIKLQIVQLLTALGLNKKDDGGKYAVLRQNRGRLVKRPKAGGLEIVATGRDDWVGWVELKTEPVDELATEHTAMVVRDVSADIQAVVEAEDRVALRDFSSIVLSKVGGTPFDHVMLVDGNDDRGIDVGIVTGARYEISTIRSHVDDADAGGQIFSRDCPEYTITTPSGQRLVLLINHLKSKGFGKTADNNARRERQATRVAQIYRRLRKDGEKNIAVLGDLNDIPGSAPLQPLLVNTDLRDIATHPTFTSDGRPGTFANGTKSNKIDYILLSPALFKLVTGGAIFRRGVWGGKNGTLWPHYPTMTKASEAASDHAALYADINL